MSDSLKDQLLKLGFKRPERNPDRPPKPQHGHAKPHAHAPAGEKAAKPAPQRPRGELDLAKAYAIRAQAERTERDRAEREAQERARENKERKAKLAALFEGKALNDPNADVARHFPHGAKIRRVYVTPEQLAQLNRGELGVVQMKGRYLVVARELALEAKAISDDALVLLPDPEAPADDDIPADLVW